MHRRLIFAALTMTLICLPAQARGGYKVNPHAPNGYNASMAGYHYHGTHAPSGEMNGYAATSIRNKHGAEPLLVPDTPSGGGGGRFSGRSGGFGGHGRDGEEGSGRFSNRGGGEEYRSGGFGNRFNESSESGRFGDRGEDGGGRFAYRNENSNARYGSTSYGAASANNEYWSNHFRNNCQPQYAQNQSYVGAQQYTQTPVYNQVQPYNQAQSYNQVQTYAQAQPYQPALRHPAEQIAGARLTQNALSHRYQNQNQYSTSNTALRTMVSNRPVQNLLRNSQGGFHKIYTTE
jgi:hypothetical protein